MKWPKLSRARLKWRTRSVTCVPRSLRACREVNEFWRLDSPASFGNDALRCRCGSVARVGCGLCVSCLLQHGLHREEPQMDSFDAALAEIVIRDSDWRRGNYQILEEIGRGGMDVIYCARQRDSRPIMALKRRLSYHPHSSQYLLRLH